MRPILLRVRTHRQGRLGRPQADAALLAAAWFDHPVLDALALATTAAPSRDDVRIWILALPWVLLIPAILWAAVRENRPARLADRRLWIFAHPALTVVGRVLVSLVAAVVIPISALLAVRLHPSMWSVVAATVTGYAALVVSWVLARGGPDLDALGADDAQEV